MYTLTAEFQAVAGKEEQLKALLLTLVTPTRAEAGCVKYELYQDSRDPACFFFYEIWVDKAAHAQHMQTAHIQHWRKQREGLLAKSGNIKFLELVE